jgi:multidrug efflux pump subunit AcrA (membrane-fusion protein)
MVKVKFLSSSPDEMAGVLPEMSARVSFLSKAITDAAKDEKPKKVVASDAIVERNGSTVVFAIAEGKLHSIPVKAGPPLGGGAVELLDGPPPGTKVVVKPSSDATDGQRIKETEK